MMRTGWTAAGDTSDPSVKLRTSTTFSSASSRKMLTWVVRREDVLDSFKCAESAAAKPFFIMALYPWYWFPSCGRTM